MNKEASPVAQTEAVHKSYLGQATLVQDFITLLETNNNSLYLTSQLNMLISIMIIREEPPLTSKASNVEDSIKSFSNSSSTSSSNSSIGKSPMLWEEASLEIWEVTCREARTSLLSQMVDRQLLKTNSSKFSSSKD